MKIYQQSNVAKRSHNYSPIMNYEDVRQPTGLQSTLLNSQQEQRNFIYSSTEGPKDAKASARIEMRPQADRSPLLVQEIPSTLPEIANNGHRVFVPVPTSITIINNDNSVNNFNNYYVNNKRENRAPSRGRGHQRMMSVMPLEERLAKKVLHGDRARGLVPIEKATNISHLSPQHASFNASSLGSTAHTPVVGPIGSAGAVIGGQGAPLDIKNVNEMFKLKHSELRQKSKRLQRPMKPLDDVIKIGKFEGYSVTSNNNNQREVPINKQVAYTKDLHAEDFNFPQIHNLKSDLEDILSRRASYIQNSHKKRKITAIYGLHKRKPSLTE
jgi:hypothetical protein